MNGNVGGSVGDDVRLARATLSRISEPARKGLWDLVERHGPIETLARLRAGEVPEDCRRFVAARRDDLLGGRAERDLEAITALGGRLIVPEDEEWPTERLSDLQWIHEDREPTMPPMALWVRGPLRVGEACARSVAVVGARASTSYGNHVAGELGYGLADRGWAVVSGGAYGIDGAAHRGTLAAGGTTVAILACGVDRPYPVGHSALFDRIAAEGLLLSEWPPGSSPQRPRFLVRNRVIAALSVGTVVVEAAARSGARHTARRAGELSRAVLVVPGPVTSMMSVGCHQLLREHGARLVTRAAEVVEEVERMGEGLVEPPRDPESRRDTLDETLQQVLEGIPSRGAASADQVARNAAVGILPTLQALTRLVSAGFAEESGEGYRLTPAAREARVPGAPPSVRQ